MKQQNLRNPILEAICELNGPKNWVSSLLSRTKLTEPKALTALHLLAQMLKERGEACLMLPYVLAFLEQPVEVWKTLYVTQLTGNQYDKLLEDVLQLTTILQSSNPLQDFSMLVCKDPDLCIEYVMGTIPNKDFEWYLNVKDEVED